MVFLSSACFLFKQGGEKFRRVQQQLRFSWHFYGRKRNCYKIGYRYVMKALSKGVWGRQKKLHDLRYIWRERINAASLEHGMEGKMFLEGIARSSIQLDTKILSTLAIYEPRTFKSLTEISKETLIKENLPFTLERKSNRTEIFDNLIKHESHLIQRKLN